MSREIALVKGIVNKCGYLLNGPRKIRVVNIVINRE